MKLAELERHLRLHGCVLYREGAAHSIWFNPALHRSPASRAIAKQRGNGAGHLQTTGDSPAIGLF
jgi:hypothetical protein